MFSVNTILHPTDFSALSRNAFDLACSMAKQQGARVILLHVAVPPPPAAPMPYDAAGIHTEHLLDEGKLRGQLEELRSEKPNVTLEYVFERGNPSEVILRIAEKADCDAIVMGTHGRSGLTRLLMGSVAESVLREAPCPVVTVNAPTAKEQSTKAEETASVSK